MDIDEATYRIEEAYRDSGNCGSSIDKIDLREALAEAKADGEDYVFIKPSSGYEVEIPVAVVEAFVK